MSTVRYTKDHGGVKAGTVASVPFGVGQTLVAAKVAEYPPSAPIPTGKVRPAPPPNPLAAVAERHAADIKRLNEQHARSVAEIKEDAAVKAAEVEKAHAAEVAKLKADLDAANALIAELNAKKK